MAKVAARAIPAAVRVVVAKAARTPAAVRAAESPAKTILVKTIQGEGNAKLRPSSSQRCPGPLSSEGGPFAKSITRAC